jgi:hypothetical protein
MNLESLIDDYDGSSDQFHKLTSELKKNIKEIICNDTEIRTILMDSYIHQLGFEKYTIKNLRSGKSIRLHFWPNKDSSKEDIHSHCASFKSIILNGAIKQNSYDLVTGTDMKKFLYTFDAKTRSSKANEAGLTSYKFRDSITLVKNNFYNQSYLSMHQVAETDLNTLTISLWEKREYPAIVLKELPSDVQDCIHTNSLSEEFLKRRLQKFLELF